MDIVHIKTMLLVFTVINVLGLGIHSCTGVTGNTPETIKEIFTERLVLDYGGGLYLKYVS